MQTNSRILIIATWFGPPPTWLPLWLTSCRFNSDINWLLVADHDLSDIDIPNNVQVAKITMHEFAERMAISLGFSINFTRAYKACDFKPLYCNLLDLAHGSWEFWGHCDLDMIFGNIRAFLTPQLLQDNDRIFGVGHLSIYRNNEIVNNFYRRPCPGLDYRNILSDPNSHGFDEHNGVNRIWHLHKGRFYQNEDVIADIDPHFKDIRRTSSLSNVRNFRHQVFGFNQGKVFRASIHSRETVLQEFMYIHFQKRKIPPPTQCLSADRFWLTPIGFLPMENSQPSKREIAALNPNPLIPSPNEFVHVARKGMRTARKYLSSKYW